MELILTLIIFIKYYLTLLISPNKLHVVKVDRFGRQWIHKLTLNELIMRHKNGEDIKLYLLNLF